MPPIIRTHDLRKTFRTPKRRPGVAGALRTLFSREYEDKIAVRDVNMELEAGELVGYIAFEVDARGNGWIADLFGVRDPEIVAALLRASLGAMLEMGETQTTASRLGQRNGFVGDYKETPEFPDAT